MDIKTMRRMQIHKWAQLVAIKREQRKNRPPKERRTKQERCRPRYNLLGG